MPKFLQPPMSNCYNGYMVNNNNTSVGSSIAGGITWRPGSLISLQYSTDTNFENLGLYLRFYSLYLYLRCRGKNLKDYKKYKEKGENYKPGFSSLPAPHLPPGKQISKVFGRWWSQCKIYTPAVSCNRFQLRKTFQNHHSNRCLRISLPRTKSTTFVSEYLQNLR